MALSVLFYLQAFFIIYLLLLSVGANCPYLYVALVTPVVYLLEALPISINGLGVREGAFFFFLSQIGVPGEQIVAFSILVLLNRTLTNLSGGVFLLAGGTDWQPQKAEATPGVEAA